jgi:hypothetical protein
MNKIAKSVVQGTPVGTGVGMRPETLDLEIDDLYELSSPNMSTHIRRLRPYVSAWEADRKAASEMAVERQDLLARIEALERELGAFVALFDPDRKNLVTAFVRATALAAEDKG